MTAKLFCGSLNGENFKKLSRNWNQSREKEINVPKSRIISSQENEPAIQPLDKKGFIPLYYQIQRALMEQIRSGQLAEGDPLASEEELSRYYQVSRMTARQALHGLKTKGYAF